jgi:hypothetical protein
MRPMQPPRLLRVVICKEQTHHRYSIAKKSSYSSNFRNGEGARKTFRNKTAAPGVTMLRAKGSNDRRSGRRELIVIS